MMTINAHTKIASIIKEHPDALEAIISLSRRFEKLRNPVLRKIMGGRTSIATASRIGGCSVNEFFDKLKALGFKIETMELPVEEQKKPSPRFMDAIKMEQLLELDVRPLIASGNDPLRSIQEKVKSMGCGQVLKIINSFEPLPLIRLLEKSGFEVYSDVINDDYAETWFFKPHDAACNFEQGSDTANGWDEKLTEFKDRLQTIDVRDLEMPMPMITVLEALDKLPADKALFVDHKRIPVFLLPELSLRNFGFRIREISEGRVNLLIFRI
jgi:uncharacterized protein (DUF2249 family)